LEFGFDRHLNPQLIPIVLEKVLSQHWHLGHAVGIEPDSGRILRNSGIIETVAGDFRPAAASKTQICNAETAIEFTHAVLAGFFAAMA
jgi:hypothetical protein